jgi:uncharacterized protein involved in exopolysaccharide biosynthesis
VPKFELLPLINDQLQSATGKRAQIIREYLGYSEQLPKGQAASVEASAEDPLTAIRRKLTAVAKLAGKELEIKRTGDRACFSLSLGGRCGRGRPPTVASASA